MTTNNQGDKMSKENEKTEFVKWFSQQSDKVRYAFATTPYDSRDAIGVFRRRYLRMLRKVYKDVHHD